MLHREVSHEGSQTAKSCTDVQESHKAGVCTDKVARHTEVQIYRLTGHTHEIWHRLNIRLTKWVRWEKDLSTRAAIRYLKTKYKEKPGLFPHWTLVHP